MLVDDLPMSVTFDRILFPTDFSELANLALGYAVELANKYGAQVHALHVVDDAYQYWSAMGPESIPVGPPPEDLLDLGRSRMKAFEQEHLIGLDRPALTHVTMGRPFSEIVAYARNEKVDLIVMGTHGRGAIAHVLLGSTTEKVVRKSGCAVLTVRGEHKFVMP